MGPGPDTLAAPAPLALEGLPLWLVEQGMRGLPLGEQLGGYCRRVYDAGFPMKRALMGMDTLHPRYGSHAFVWRPDAGAVEYAALARTSQGQEVYLRSPVHHMRSRGILKLRRRLDREGAEDFQLFAELRAEGFTDYAARMVPFDPQAAEAVAAGSVPAGGPERQDPLDGIFFSCATDRPEGFDVGQLAQVIETLPYLALAVKARLTYDVASTVVETYLGADAGQRVLTGTIERGSTQAIRAVIWFADLRGFTRLADTLPRAALIALLNDYLEVLAQPVHAHGGQILKFLGDGLLATFDLTGRDPAAVCRDALAAAAELRAAFPAFNAARQAAGRPVTGFGLALHLGEVLYGNIGASERLDFTVVGPAVNEASRIQALCRPLDRDVLISTSFREAVGADAGLRSLGLHPLRDVTAPQELFTLR